MKTILAYLNRGVLCAALLAAGGCSRAAKQEELPPPPPQRIITPASWPVFRGDTQLSGCVPGLLPDALALRWSFKAGGAIKSSPVIARGAVYFGANDSQVYAVNLADGQKRWSYAADDTVEAPPLVVGEWVIAGTSAGTLVALQASDGAVQWKYAAGNRLIGGANIANAAKPEAARIVLGCYDNRLHCLEAITGKLVWTYETQGYINGAPAISGDRVVFGGCDATLHILSLADGKALGAVAAESYIPGSVAVADDAAYFGQYGNKLMCVDLKTLQVRWTYEAAANAAPFFASPAVSQEQVVCGSRDGLVHCVSRADGRLLWSFAAQGDVDSSPVICGDKVLAASTAGRLYLLRLDDGALLWKYEIGAPVVASPAVANGTVVVCADDGRVYAFGLNPAPAAAPAAKP